jgi:hypothetical protein
MAWPSLPDSCGNFIAGTSRNVLLGHSQPFLNIDAKAAVIGHLRALLPHPRLDSRSRCGYCGGALAGDDGENVVGLVNKLKPVKLIAVKSAAHSPRQFIPQRHGLNVSHGRGKGCAQRRHRNITPDFIVIASGIVSHGRGLSG